MKKTLITAGIVVSLFVAALGYLQGYWRFNYPSHRTYPIRGIDVSHHQGRIDWNKVKGQGFHFVYMKATEGGDFKDSFFQKNWEGVSRSGLVKGAYHFFTFCRLGTDQAKNFIGVVPADPNALPPAIDIEFVGNCKARPGKEEFLKELFQFVHEIEGVYKKPPILYVTYESYDYYLKWEIDHYEVWIRDIFRKPRLPNRQRWSFWQYSDQGKVDGIRGPVDLNVYNGSGQAFSNLQNTKGQ